MLHVTGNVITKAPTAMKQWNLQVTKLTWNIAVETW